MQKMLIGAAALLAAGLPAPVHANDVRSYQDIMARAGAAFQAEDWAALDERLIEAQALRPYSLYIWKNRILARQLKGDSAGAMALATKIADRGLAVDLSGHDAFDALKAEPAFEMVGAKFEDNMMPIGDAAIVTQYDDINLLPEAYAIDRKGTQYIGSVRTGKIIEFSSAAAPKGIAFAQGGVFDIEVRGKKLWAAVNDQLAYEGADPENKFASLMVFNLKTGAPLREIRVGEPDALLGDLEVAKDGTAYASDSVTPRLYKMARGGQTLDIFAADPRFVNLQGIALDEKNHRIFVADYLAGLFVIDTDNAEVTAIKNTVDAHLGGIDGLYLYKGELIGIQNGTTPQRIVKIMLNDEANEAIRFEVLQQNLDDWNEPTHGAVAGDNFNYIATSNWPSYDRDWNIREGAALQPVRIMTFPLDSK